MIDIKHLTFLEVCRLKNFTKTADVLCITPPAVSQHIKHLEEVDGGKLITFSKRNFELPEKGKVLYNFLSTLQVDCQRAVENIHRESEKVNSVSFGATLTIGEYLMPPIVENLIKKNDALKISMLVDNTKALLDKLDQGVIEFALIEGTFNKNKYASKTFSSEPFIAVCSSKLLPRKRQRFEKLCANRLIVREKGSGTRMVLEQILEEKSLDLNHFYDVVEIGNMSAIKELVKTGIGISFLYKAAVTKELEEESLCEIPIKDFIEMREFNFVFLKNSQFSSEYIEWCELFKEYHNVHKSY